MPSLWFVMPASGRAQLARICFRQLRRTCDALTANGIEASAVVVADDENLQTAHELGFATVRRDNRFLGARFNDGFQAACDPEHNPRPADFAVPIGSDDWIDWRILTRLPAQDRVLVFEQIAFVREDGGEITSRRVRNFIGGCGIRVYPRQVLARLGYRPVDEDRERGCDTSTWVNLSRRTSAPPRLVNGDRHPFQLVDWKSPSEQINAYEDVAMHRANVVVTDPFEALAGVYPAEALDEMRAHYGAREAVAA